MNRIDIKPGDTVTGIDLAYRAQQIIREGLESASGGSEYEDYTINSLAQMIEWIVVSERILIPSSSDAPLLNGIIEPYEDVLDTLYIPGTYLDRSNALKETFIPMDIKKLNKSVRVGSIVIHHKLLQVDPFPKIIIEENINSLNRNSYMNIANRTLRKIEDVARGDIDIANQYLESYFKLDIPLIFNQVIERAKQRKDIIPIAMELRHSKEATAFRQQLKLLDEAAAIDDRKTLIQLLSEIDDKIKLLNKKVSQPLSGLSIAIPLPNWD
jgi:hypothetical protein